MCSGDNTIIMACSSLRHHVKAAQQRMGTSFEVVELNRALHAKPARMRDKIIETMAGLPPQIETVLVGMGFCGGSWNQVQLNHRVVIPKVDDCITLLLHTDDTRHANLKKPGHFYFRDSDTGAYTLRGMLKRLCEKHGREEGKSIFKSWFKNYTNADIIDTGAYDCHSPAYLEKARQNADLIHCALGHVSGSNRILEKMVSGRWDEQFLVLYPNIPVTMEAFQLPPMIW